MLERLGIQRGEVRLFVWCAVVLFLLGWAEVSVKNVSEVFFIKRVDIRLLPLAFLLSSFLLVGTTYALGVVASRGDRLRLLTFILVLLAASLIPLWLLVRGDIAGGFGLLVIASKQLESIALMAFLLALGDLLHPRQAKRLLAPLMAGTTLGTMLGSFASDPIGDWLGIDGLLPFSAGVFLLAAVCTLPLRRTGRPRRLRRTAGIDDEPLVAVAAAAPGEPTSLARMWRESPLFRLLAGLTFFNALLGPMLYYQFQFVADLATAGQDGEAALLEIYAQFRGWISVGILVTQVGFASGLYRRIGLPLSALFSPVVYLLGFVGLSLQLSLAAGVGAMAGTKLVDNAVYDPALRVLYNLFREGIRSRSSGLLEGPVKRSGGVVGNVITAGAVWIGNTGWVGYLALPIAAVWLVVSFVLWRIYPSLLIGAAAHRGARGFDRLPVSELLDRTTERALAQRLASSDPETVRIAMDLCAEADPMRAVSSFARAALNAPPETRSLLVSRLDRILEEAVSDPFTCRAAADDLEKLLAAENGVTGLDRADVVQAHARLTQGEPRDEDRELLERILLENAPAVRLAARAALCRRGAGEQGELDEALTLALRGSDPDARHVAREELRALLIEDEPQSPGNAFASRLDLMTGCLERCEGAERAALAEAVADVTARHGAAARRAAEALLEFWEDPDPRTRVASLRAAGFAGLREHACSIVACVGDPDDRVAAGARDAVLALGHAAADVLLVELSYGRRSRRDAILRLIREIEVEEEALRGLYRAELDELRRTLVHRVALESSPASPIVLQRLDERIDENTHAVLQLLSALHDDEAIADVSQHLRRTREAHQRSILVEAVEALLQPDEKKAIVPLLEDRPLAQRATSAAQLLGESIPRADQVLRRLREDRDELTRILVRATSDEQGAPLARGSDLGDHRTMLEPVEIALYLRKTPLFESLATRHLVEIASVVHEERHPSHTRLFEAGQTGTCMYLIVDGRIRIHRGDASVAELGPEEFFGEVGLLEAVERSASATTLSAVRLLRLEQDDLLELMDELPAIAIGVAQELSKRLRGMVERVDH